MNKARIAVAVLSFSLGGFASLAGYEHYTREAVIPTKNDRPTVGLGSTFHEDGTPVRLGDTTTPVRAILKAAAHISREEQGFRASLPGVALHQAEYDVYMDWVYQYGIGAWQRSAMRSHLLAGEYESACQAMVAYKYLKTAKPTPGWEAYKFDATGKPIGWRFDCSTPGNRTCRGVWTRLHDRVQKCMEAQS